MKWNQLGAFARLWLSLAVLLLPVAGPLLVSLAASLVAMLLGCRLDEGGVHPCSVLGLDIGGALYMFGMLFWFGLFALPIVAIGFIVWLRFAVVLLFKHARRSTPM
ncbi:MAG: hypothetical protein WBW74_21545 [Xanthobacteraceae bacterium]